LTCDGDGRRSAAAAEGAERLWGLPGAGVTEAPVVAPDVLVPLVSIGGRLSAGDREGRTATMSPVTAVIAAANAVSRPGSVCHQLLLSVCGACPVSAIKESGVGSQDTGMGKDTGKRE